MKRIILGIIAVAVVFLAWYIVSPYFSTRAVDEPLPFTVENISQLQHRILYRGSFTDGDKFHKVSGSVLVLFGGDKSYLRFENFKSSTGPLLRVYVSRDGSVDNAVPVDLLKGTQGNQNYEIPLNVSFAEYKYVVIWSDAFRVLFGKAQLSK